MLVEALLNIEAHEMMIDEMLAKEQEINQKLKEEQKLLQKSIQ